RHAGPTCSRKPRTRMTRSATPGNSGAKLRLAVELAGQHRLDVAHPLRQPALPVGQRQADAGVLAAVAKLVGVVGAEEDLVGDDRLRAGQDVETPQEDVLLRQVELALIRKGRGGQTERDLGAVVAERAVADFRAFEELDGLLDRVD